MRKQKVGLENATRTALLDAAEALMREEGYAAVTSRKLGVRAGVRPQLVHYYFPTMDALFLAALRRRSETGLKAAEAALESDQPLRALWMQSCDTSEARLNLEYLALANHRKAIQAELADLGERLRRTQEAALARHFEARGIEAQLTAPVVVLIMSSVGLTLVLESNLGMRVGHAEMEALVERELQRFEALGRDPAPAHPLIGRSPNPA